MIGIGRLAALWGLAILTTGAAVTAASVARAFGLAQSHARVAEIVTVAATVLVGALILTARPGHRVGRLMLTGGALWGLAAPFIEWCVVTLLEQPGRTDLAGIAVVALTMRGAGWILLVAALALVFPDGDLPGPRWRWTAALPIAALAGVVTGSLFSPHPIDLRIEHLRNPLAPAGALEVLPEAAFLLGFALALLSALTGFAAVAVRWRRGDAMLREQIGWFVMACILVPVVMAAALVDVSEALPYALAVVALPITIGFAVLQRRLYDIELVVHRTLLYVLLSASVIGVYLLAVAGVGSMLGISSGLGLGLLGAGAAAAAAEPLRRTWLRGVNRLVYGDWEDPHEVGRRLGVRLADAAAPHSALDAALAELSTALRLRWIAIECDGHLLASAGGTNAGTFADGASAGGTDADSSVGSTEAVAAMADRADFVGAMAGSVVASGALAGTLPSTSDEIRTPLTHQGELVGLMRTAAGRRLRRRDVALLESVARQIAPVVQARHLADELRRSRDRLIAAQQTERHRLRRDLHDGLGPTLAALAFKVDTARNVMAADPATDPAAETLLLEIRDRLRDTVADVRRVVDGLRPPYLDDLGLDGALTRLVADLPGPTRFYLRLPAVTGTLTEPVQLAVYRIAQEALTNVVRHSGAERCDVALDVTAHSVVLSIHDDGSGGTSGISISNGNGNGGNGMATMRERADELGGTLSIAAQSAQGTRITVTLPR